MYVCVGGGEHVTCTCVWGEGSMLHVRVCVHGISMYECVYNVNKGQSPHPTN